MSIYGEKLQEQIQAMAKSIEEFIDNAKDKNIKAVKIEFDDSNNARAIKKRLQIEEPDLYEEFNVEEFTRVKKDDKYKDIKDKLKEKKDKKDKKVEP